jgi:hypothetical protein
MKPTDSPLPAATARSGGNPLLLVLFSFILGAALAGFLVYRGTVKDVLAKNTPLIELSDATKNVLAHLAAPVTIHYYSLLPADRTDATLPDFATRVGQLLDAMQAASGGKLQVVTLDNSGETNAVGASADGLKVFNLENGHASYLGLALASGPHKEVFDRLLPEWEPALEFDLARALQRVAIPAAPAPMAPEVAKPSADIVASVNRLIPDINSTTVETADQIFHAEFMKEIADAGTEMDAKMTAAQQQVTQAQASGSPTDLEAAQKNLAQVQSAQGEKIRQIAATLKTRLAVFQQMKAAATK